VQPLFPQFGRACPSFVKPTGFPRPFAALDWCPRCGQPDWAHQADGADRIALLGRLGERQRRDMLRYVCEYSPATFDIALEAVTAPGDPADPAEEDVVEPFCLACGAALALSPDDGRWRHRRDTPGARLYLPDHPTVPGWRDPVT
jgi:hypothetical protein